MSLLAILISLALEKLLPAMNGLRSFAWFGHYQSWVRSRLANHSKWQGIPSLLLIVLLPTIGIAVVQYYLNDLLVLFSFVFSIIVLTYCLGPEDEHRRVNDYLDAIEDENRSDKDSIQTDLSEILQAGGITSTDTDETTRTNKLIESILIITHERMLAVLFWFVILGPMGAVLYRLTLALVQHEAQRQVHTDDQNTSPVMNDETAETQTDNSEEKNHDSDSEFNSSVKRLHFLLGWIPSHLTALSYAVMGSFVHALRAWQNKPSESQIEGSTETSVESKKESTSANNDLLIRIGMASLQFDSKPPTDNNAVRETLGLCGRSLVAWITILAIMTLAGWAS